MQRNQEVKTYDRPAPTLPDDYYHWESKPIAEDMHTDQPGELDVDKLYDNDESEDLFIDTEASAEKPVRKLNYLVVQDPTFQNEEEAKRYFELFKATTIYILLTYEKKLIPVETPRELIKYAKKSAPLSIKETKAIITATPHKLEWSKVKRITHFERQRLRHHLDGGLFYATPDEVHILDLKEFSRCNLDTLDAVVNDDGLPEKPIYLKIHPVYHQRSWQFLTSSRPKNTPWHFLDIEESEENASFQDIILGMLTSKTHFEHIRGFKLKVTHRDTFNTSRKSSWANVLQLCSNLEAISLESLSEDPGASGSYVIDTAFPKLRVLVDHLTPFGFNVNKLHQTSPCLEEISTNKAASFFESPWINQLINNQNIRKISLFKFLGRISALPNLSRRPPLEFEVKEINDSECIELLKNLPRLRKLSLHTVVQSLKLDDFKKKIEEAKISLPELTELTWDNCSESNLYLLATIMEASPNLTTLRITFDRVGAQRNDMLPLFARANPQLKTLILLEGHLFDNWIIQLLQSSQKTLKTLVIKRDGFNYVSNSVNPLEFPQLKIFDISGPPLDDHTVMHSILSSPSLEKVSLSHMIFADTQMFAETILSLHNLKELTLNEVTIQDKSDFYAPGDLPALTKFQFFDRFNADMTVIGSILLSAENLEEFTLNANHEPLTLPPLPQLRSLREIHLMPRNHINGIIFLHQLIPLAPRLTKLCVDFTNASGKNWEPLKDSMNSLSLRDLTIIHCPISIWPFFLQLSPSLRTLSIASDVPYYEPDELKAVSKLNELTELELTLKPGKSFGLSILDLAPQLRSLKLLAIKERTDNYPKPLNFKDRPFSTTLEKLDLESIDVTFSHFLPYLRLKTIVFNNVLLIGSKDALPLKSKYDKFGFINPTQLDLDEFRIINPLFTNYDVLGPQFRVNFLTLKFDSAEKNKKKSKNWLLHLANKDDASSEYLTTHLTFITDSPMLGLDKDIETIRNRCRMFITNFKTSSPKSHAAENKQLPFQNPQRPDQSTAPDHKQPDKRPFNVHRLISSENGFPSGDNQYWLWTITEIRVSNYGLVYGYYQPNNSQTTNIARWENSNVTLEQKYESERRKHPHRHFMYGYDVGTEKQELPGLSTNDSIIYYEADEECQFIPEQLDSKNQDKPGLARWFATASRPTRVKYIFKRSEPEPKLEAKTSSTSAEAKTAVKKLKFKRAENSHPDGSYAVEVSGIDTSIDRYTFFDAVLAFVRPLVHKNVSMPVDPVAYVNRMLAEETGPCRFSASMVMWIAKALNISCWTGINQSHLFVIYRDRQGNLRQEYGMSNYSGEVNVFDVASGHQLNSQDTAEESKRHLQSAKKEEIIQCVTPLERKTLSPTIDHPADEKRLLSIDQPPLSVPEKKQLRPPIKDFFTQLTKDKNPSLHYFSNDERQRDFIGCLMEEMTRLGQRVIYLNDLDKITAEQHAFLENIRPFDTIIANCSKQSKGLFHLYAALDPTICRFINHDVSGVKFVCVAEKTMMGIYSHDHSFLRRAHKEKNDTTVIDEVYHFPQHYINNRLSTKKPNKTASLTLRRKINWRTELLGINKPPYKVVASTLAKVLAENKGCDELILVNAPEEDPAFNLMLIQWMATNRLYLDGKWQNVTYIPIRFVQPVYDFTKRCECEHSTPDNIHEVDYILNRSTFSQFIKGFDPKSMTDKRPGLFEKHRSNKLVIRVIHSFPDGELLNEWLSQAEKHQIKIKFLFDKGIVVAGLSPTPLKSNQTLYLPAPSELKRAADLKQQKFSVVFCKEYVAAACLIAKEFKDTHVMVVHVSKTHKWSDIVQKYMFQGSKESKDFTCEHFETDITKAKQQENNTVILSGDFAPKVTSQFATCSAKTPYEWINCTETPLRARFIIVTPPNRLFSYAQTFTFHVPRQEKKLEAKETVRESHKADELQMRIDLFDKMLMTSKCILLEGETGVGKTSLVTKYYPQNKPNVVVRRGLNALEKCIEEAKSDSTKQYILFVDEARLKGDGAFDRFESAYYPGHEHALAHGKTPRWPENMNVAFATNKKYEGREDHGFFDRHPEMRMEMQEYSSEYIRHVLFSSLLPKIKRFSDNEKKQIIAIFFQVTQFQTKKITFRNWKMMCERLKLSINEKRFDNNLMAARFAAYDEAEGLLLDRSDRTTLQIALFGTTEHYRQLAENIDKTVAENLCAQLPPPEEVKGEAKQYPFVLTKSRHRPIRLLSDQLKLDGHIKLTGPTSAGKTAIGKLVLKACKYIEMKNAAKSPTDTMIFYHITGNNLGKIKEAAKIGAKILWDEADALLTRLVEEVINSLDFDNTEEVAEGFSIIATGNGFDHAARFAWSEACENRFTHVEVEDYSLNEKREILKSAANFEGPLAEKLLKEAQVKEWSLAEILERIEGYLLQSVNLLPLPINVSTVSNHFRPHLNPPKAENENFYSIKIPSTAIAVSAIGFFGNHSAASQGIAASCEIFAKICTALPLWGWVLLLSASTVWLARNIYQNCKQDSGQDNYAPYRVATIV